MTDPPDLPPPPQYPPTEDEGDVLPRQPRDPGAIVASAFRLYRRYPWLFLSLAAGVIVPMT